MAAGKKEERKEAEERNKKQIVVAVVSIHYDGDCDRESETRVI